MCVDSTNCTGTCSECVADAATLPPRPEGLPRLGVSGLSGRVPHYSVNRLDDEFGITLDGGLTEAEARYVVALVDAAPAIEAELSALREARREQDEETTKLNRYLEDAAIWKVGAITREGELRALVREAIDIFLAPLDSPENMRTAENAVVEKARAAIGTADATGQAGGGG